MSVRINLTLEASEMFLSLHMIFIQERAAVVWAILERISGFDPSLEMIAPRYLKFSTSSSLWPFILISLWKPFGLFVITFVFLGRSPFCTLWWLYRGGLPGRQLLLPLQYLWQGHLQSRPPMLTLPSCSSNASHMILSRKILKRVGESRHPCLLQNSYCSSEPFSCVPLNSIGLCHTDFQWLVRCWHWCCISS